jgi:hypothetical protein
MRRNYSGRHFLSGDDGLHTEMLHLYTALGSTSSSRSREQAMDRHREASAAGGLPSRSPHINAKDEHRKFVRHLRRRIVLGDLCYKRLMPAASFIFYPEGIKRL